MATIGGLAVWQDVGVGLLLMVLMLVAAELLARHIEVDPVRRRAASASHAVPMANCTLIAEEFR